MLAAILAAEREILLEMYWIGSDAAGERFRDALCTRARAGVSVRVIYDAVGSIGLSESWWEPLFAAGGQVIEHGPVAPWRQSFHLQRVFFRDHRKILVVDGATAFVGGINLARQWLPREEGGEGWRDDAIEVRGAAASELRELVSESWERGGGRALETVARATLHGKRRTWVLADQAEGARHHRIRRVYISAIRRARTSIDICAAYFLPGPLFLQALLAASHRGVRVRVLVPAHGDVRVVQLAMIGVLDHLLREGVDVFAYQPAILHSKTSIVDEQLAILGSHNLDELSLRFNLESNLVVDDRAFAAVVARSFERDLEQSKKLDLRSFSDRSASSRLLASVAARLRAFL